MPYLKINQIQAGMINIKLLAKIVKTVQLNNGKYKLILDDGTGRINLISPNQFLINSTVRIEKAYAYRYKGELSLGVMKRGKITNA